MLFIISRRTPSIPGSNSNKCTRPNPFFRFESRVVTEPSHTVERPDGFGSGLVATLSMTPY